MKNLKRLVSLSGITLGLMGCAQTAAPPRPTAQIQDMHAERISMRAEDLRAVEATLRQVLGLNADPERAPTDIAAIFVEYRTEELVVLGTNEGIERVKKMLTPGLMNATRGDDDLEVVVPLHVDAGDLANALGAVAPATVRVVAMSPKNRIVVMGPKADRARLLSLVKQLDTDAATEVPAAQ